MKTYLLAGAAVAALTFSLVFPFSHAFADDDEQPRGNFSEKMMERCLSKGNSPEECREKMEKRRAKIEKRCSEEGLSKEECQKKLKEKREARRKKMQEMCDKKGLSKEDCGKAMKRHRNMNKEKEGNAGSKETPMDI